jgi:hypothetical protein
MYLYAILVIRIESQTFIFHYLSAKIPMMGGSAMSLVSYALYKMLKCVAKLLHITYILQFKEKTIA